MQFKYDFCLKHIRNFLILAFCCYPNYNWASSCPIYAIGLCTDFEICQSATEISNEGQIFFATETQKKWFVREAKSRGINCGAGENVVQKCYQNGFSNCKTEAICSEFINLTKLSESSHARLLDSTRIKHLELFEVMQQYEKVLTERAFYCSPTSSVNTQNKASLTADGNEKGNPTLAVAKPKDDDVVLKTSIAKVNRAPFSVTEYLWFALLVIGAWVYIKKKHLQNKPSKTVHAKNSKTYPELMIDSDQSSEEKGPSAKHNLDQITKKNESHAADESIAKKIQPVNPIKAKVDLKSDKILTLQGIHKTEIKSKSSLPKSPTAQDRLSGTRRAQDGGTKLNKSEPPGLAKANALEKAKLQQQVEVKSSLNNESTISIQAVASAYDALASRSYAKTSQPNPSGLEYQIAKIRRAQAAGIKLNKSELRILARADAEDKARLQQQDEAKSNLSNESTVTTKGANKAAIDSKPSKTPKVLNPQYKLNQPNSAEMQRLVPGIRQAHAAGIKLGQSELRILARADWADAQDKAKLPQQDEAKINLNNESTVTTKGANKAAIDSKPSKTSQPKTPTTWDRVPGVRRAQASGIKLNNSELRILARADAENMAKSQKPALQKQKIQTPEARAARLRRAQKAGIKLLKSELQIIARAEAEKEAKLQQEKSYKRTESADQLLNKTDSLSAVLPSDEKMIEKNKEPELVKKTENHRFSRKIPLGLKSKPK